MSQSILTLNTKNEGVSTLCSRDADYLELRKQLLNLIGDYVDSPSTRIGEHKTLIQLKPPVLIVVQYAGFGKRMTDVVHTRNLSSFLFLLNLESAKLIDLAVKMAAASGSDISHTLDSPGNSSSLKPALVSARKSEFLAS